MTFSGMNNCRALDGLDLDAGEVTEKHTEKATIKSKGKDITKNGEPDNPAFKVERKGKNPVIKKVRADPCCLSCQQILGAVFCDAGC